MYTNTQKSMITQIHHELLNSSQYKPNNFKQISQLAFVLHKQDKYKNLTIKAVEEVVEAINC